MDSSPPLPEPQLFADEMTYDSESEIESGSSDGDDLSGGHDLSLWEYMWEYMVKSKFDKHDVYSFIPAGILDRLIKRESILKAMEIESPTEEDDALVHFIEKKAKKVFATTAYIKVCGQLLYRAMLLFKENNFDDSKLPIKPWPSDKLRKARTRTLHPFANMEGAVGEGVDPIWRSANIYDFQEAQWKFLAPIFSTSQLNHDVGKRILPFISRQTNPKEGSFGVVSKCKIHTDHIRDPLKSEGEVLLHDSFLDRTLTSFRTIPYLPSSKSKSTTNRIVKAWPHTGEKR